MPMYDAEDIVELKNRKKRKKRRIKFLVFLLIAGVVTGLYYYRDSWYPKLKGLGRKVQIIENNGRLAEGNFPIYLSGNSKYQLQYSDDLLMLMCDAYIYYYTDNGGVLKRRQHIYSNPVMKASNGNVLIYESGGEEFCLENEDEVEYTKTLDDPIMFGEVSSDGYTAIVTVSDKYACKLLVFDDYGDIIYERDCVERIGDISFINNSKGCIISYIGAANGAVTSNVQKVTFTAKEADWTSPNVETLGMQVYGNDDGAVLIGYESCSYIGDGGIIDSVYEYDGDFAGGESRGGKTAVLINDEDRRKYHVVMFNGSGDSPLSVEIGEPLKCVKIADGLVYVMSQSKLQAFDFNGELRSTVNISDTYSEFRRSEDYIFLMGYDHIDRIDYNS